MNYLQLVNKPEKQDDNYGPLVMKVGDEDEGDERFYDLDGMRVEAKEATQWDNIKTGTIQAVYINRRTKRVQVVVSMDGKGVRIFRPRRLNFIDKRIAS